LLAAGHSVICCVRDTRRFSGSEYLHHAGVTLLEVDFLNASIPSMQISDVDAAYYLIHSMSTSKSDFEKLCSNLGISEDTTVVFYGDKSNWFAVYAFWLFQYYGHKKIQIMNGGRAKWIAEGRPLTTEVPTFYVTHYNASYQDDSIRAFREDVFRHLQRKLPLVDVRSAKEYSGEMLHMPGYPQEGAQRGGHIPGAVNIPWSMAVREDNTFKNPEELAQLYREKGITPDKEIIAYCRIGERSSHTWFVLTYLLGYPNVLNYDGSWTEWGNLVGAPIEKGNPV